MAEAKRWQRPDPEVVYLVPGFHSDAVWLEDQRDYAVSLLGDMRQNLMICRVDPDYGVFVHELTYLKPYYDTHPEERAFIRELVRAGRIGTGGSYNQPAEKLIGPEGIIRNIIYGRLYHEGVLGDRPLVYAPWDVFGHCAQLSQILAKSRFAGSIWSKDIPYFYPIFWHISPDGSRMLYRRLTYAFRTANREEFMANVNRRRTELQSYGLNCDIRIDASDFKPPTAWMVGETRSLSEETPKIIVSGAGQSQFMLDVRRRVEELGLRLPVTARDMEHYHQGTPLTRVEFKIGNRLAENAVTNAEKFGAFAAALGATYPETALDKAWRQLLFGQHHDGITGPCCDRAYVDLMAGYREALDLSTEALEAALKYIGSRMDTAADAPDARALPVAVFNSLNWRRSDVVTATVELPAGWTGFSLQRAEGANVAVELVATATKRRRTEVRFRFIANDIPPLGYQVFYVVPGDDLPPTPTAKKGATIENEFYKITVDAKHGGIVSLYDKQQGREVLDVSRGPGNEIVALEENPARREPPWETWTTGPKAWSRDYAATVEVRKGAASRSLVIRGAMKDGEREQEITLYPGVKRIDCVTRLVNYRGRHDLVVLTFPSALQGLEPVYEERCAVVTRRKSKGCLDFRSQRAVNDSESGLAAPYQWFAHSSSARLRLGEPGAANSASFTLGMMTVVLPHGDAVEDLAYDLSRQLVGKGIFCTPMFDDCDRRHRGVADPQDWTIPETLNEDLRWGTSFRIALDLGGNNAYARKLVRKLTATARTAFEKRRTQAGYAFVFVLDDDMPEGRPSLPVLILSATDEDALRRGAEFMLRDFAQSADINLPAAVNASGSRQQVDDYTLAIANLGNIFTSIEADNTMVLGLMHTSPWGMTKWGHDRFPFFMIPEHKTHAYAYALCPSGGDWRAAGTYRLGYEFNNPLLAAPLTQHGGLLPTSMSFLEVQGDGLIVTAIKPRGNPRAAFQGVAPVEDPGVMVRLYEATGGEASASLSWFTDVGAAWETNLLEERERPLADCGDECACACDYVGPFAIKSYNLCPALPPARSAPQMLGREIEPVQPLHVRYWDHNLGEAPLGNAPVSVVIEGAVKTGIHIRQGGVTINTLTVGVCNNYLDRRLTGRVEIVTPEGWKTAPGYVDYDLGPNEHLTREVVLCFMSSQRNGLVKARLTHEGQVYQDVVEVGEAPRIEWEVVKRGQRIQARLKNVGEDAVEGGLQLITPLEMWGSAVGSGMALADSSPAAQSFALAPGEEGSYGFELTSLTPDGRLPDCWAIVKLYYNGRVDYKYAPGLSIPADE